MTDLLTDCISLVVKHSFQADSAIADGLLLSHEETCWYAGLAQSVRNFPCWKDNDV